MDLSLFLFVFGCSWLSGSSRYISSGPPAVSGALAAMYRPTCSSKLHNLQLYVYKLSLLHHYILQLHDPAKRLHRIELEPLLGQTAKHC